MKIVINHAQNAENKHETSMEPLQKRSPMLSLVAVAETDLIPADFRTRKPVLRPSVRRGKYRQSYVLYNV